MSRAECEKKALRCVEQLLEKDICDNQLLKSAEVLSVSQYSDVVEERNIEKLCGYPLCNASLGIISKQKYHVSIERKKIFDLTERKKFCSDTCYKCSQYFAAQLSPLPLWSRTNPIKVKFKLMSTSDSPSECNADAATNRSSPILCDSTKADIVSWPSQNQTPPPFSQLQQTHPIREKPSISVTLAPSASSPPPSSSHTPPFVTLSDNSIDVPADGSYEVLTTCIQPPKISQVSKLLNAISTWVSVPKAQGQLESCEEGLVSQDKGQFYEEHKSSGKSHNKDHPEGYESLNEGPGSQEEGYSVFLPPVDSVDVNRLQHSLFNSQLRHHLSSVCSVLDISFHRVLPQINSTVAKFRLNRHCITFRVAEWKIIIILLLIISCGESIDILKKNCVNQWLRSIKAGPDDIKLMLASFK